MHGDSVKYALSVTPKGTVWHDVPVESGATERSAWLRAFKLGQHNAGRRGIQIGGAPIESEEPEESK